MPLGFFLRSQACLKVGCTLTTASKYMHGIACNVGLHAMDTKQLRACAYDTARQRQITSWRYLPLALHACNIKTMRQAAKHS